MAEDRLVSIEIDDETLGASGPDAEHERRVAIFDLIEQNSFAVADRDEGPYCLHLSMVERRLAFDVRKEDDSPVHVFGLSMTPFKTVIRDYFMICESYYDAIRSATPHQIEAIDMARRGIHNEGSELLAARLEGKVTVDFDTSRRLFTLICALHSGQVRSQVR
ncbi:MAG: UPF0262 family protein [Henriciella sp.]|nr:UPF0262 family protein [Henriciella sp.]